MKVGDKLFCHTEFTSKYSTDSINWIKKGNTYTVIEVSEKCATIIDEEGDHNDFLLEHDIYGLDNYFYYGKILRKQKLEKLKNVKTE